MRNPSVFLLFCVSVLALGLCIPADLEPRVRQFLDDTNEEFRQRKNREYTALYEYNTNVTEENRRKANEIVIENSFFHKGKALEIKRNRFDRIQDPFLKRQIDRFSKPGYAILNTTDHEDLLKAISSMQSNYAKVKICDYHDRTKCDLSLEPEIEAIMRKSRDPEELKYYWKEWYDHAGTPVKEHFLDYIRISRHAAKSNGFHSRAEEWCDTYDLAGTNIEGDTERMYGKIMGLYKQIHAYVRNKLKEKYGPELVQDRQPIPMHLLGNLWGQTWEDIYDIVKPYPNKPDINVTDEMIRQDYTPVKLFEKGDDFFQSLNMTKLPDSFWEKSVLEKPTDGRDIICHASAWDMFSTNDVRIKQCTQVNMHHLAVVHHELGHIQYYLQYQHQPTVLRRAPNPGFHEAVGDVLSMSVSTPKHLHRIGLLPEYSVDRETRINLLMESALKKVVFLPFAYFMDAYRYQIFRDRYEEEQFNCAFWSLRSDFTGVTSPIERSYEDMDAPAKYHISADVEYWRYFWSHIFQFQFLRTACFKSGQFVRGDPERTFDNCDIYGSTEAGNAFKELLEPGASKHWRDVLETFTGDREGTHWAILEYFGPLRTWLEQENNRTGVHIGWDPPVPSRCEEPDDL